MRQPIKACQFLLQSIKDDGTSQFIRFIGIAQPTNFFEIYIWQKIIANVIIRSPYSPHLIKANLAIFVIL